MENLHQCIICSSSKIKSFNLCKSTVAGYRCSEFDEALNAPFFDLILDYCEDCSFLSQRRYGSADSLLAKLYEEHVSTQHGLSNPYFEYFANALLEKYKLTSQATVLEVGCNCGLLLKTIRDISGAKVYGVEPSKAMQKIWVDRNLSVFNAYLDIKSEALIKSYGPYDLIYFRHVFEHVPNPVEFIEIASRLLKDDGVIVLEVPYLKTILDQKRIENVSYSHLNQYCLRSLSAIFNKFGMGLVDYSLEETDGGSIVAHFKKGEITPNHLIENDMEKDLELFINYNQSLKQKIQKTLSCYGPDQLIGYGAGAKGQHLIHVLGLDAFITKVIDDTPGFEGMFIPGTKIEIVSREILRSSSLKAVINLAPTHAEKIKLNIPKELIFIDFINSNF